MLLIRRGEIVAPRAVGPCAHVDVAVLGGVKHLVDCAGFGETYYAWGQPGHDICVVGRLHFEHIGRDAACREIAGGEFYRRVGLEFHAFVQAV